MIVVLPVPAATWHNITVSVLYDSKYKVFLQLRMDEPRPANNDVYRAVNEIQT